MLQNKIIIGLLFVIFAIVGVFGIKEIKELKASKKALETQIKADNEQMQLFKLDSEQRNQELLNNEVKINDLQKKLKTQFKKDNCINIIIDDDFIKLLQDSHK